MKLVDEGNADLDAPVVRYIPEFKMKDERYKCITPRMPLNHSFGLRGTGSMGDSLFNDNDAYAQDNLLQTLSDQTLKADPVHTRCITIAVLRLLRFLVERVSGMSFTGFFIAISPSRCR
ncbi:serine hydrolase [Paenibacillus tyrfis]|uniref:serine hydrolase n=1 Tax=Paenibacillus tyrfis TaxID=1501230 RepID=UPI000B58E9B5|nr:serine hydrolase [Paenibacillus tyrfis]